MSALPSDFLRLAEDHPCFSGCWSHPEVSTCVVEPGRVEEVVTVQCSDCLTRRISIAHAHLGGVASYALGQEVSDHVRSLRGYGFAVSGYHTQGGGFWLTAAWMPQLGAFLLASDKGRQQRAPLDQLLHAFRSGVATAPLPGMMTPSSYLTHDVFVRVRRAPTARDVRGWLASGDVSTTRQAGFVRATVAEYLPAQAQTPNATTGAGAPPSVSSRSASVQVAPAGSQGSGVNRATPVPAAWSSPAARSAPRKAGEVCPVCGEEVRERLLLTSTFLGCACG